MRRTALVAALLLPSLAWADDGGGLAVVLLVPPAVVLAAITGLAALLVRTASSAIVSAVILGAMDGGALALLTAVANDSWQAPGAGRGGVGWALGAAALVVVAWLALAGRAAVLRRREADAAAPPAA